MRNLTRVRENYQAELAQIDEELRGLPPGRLTKKRKFFYHVYEGKEVGITHNHGLIRQLCRKKLLLTWKRQLESHLSGKDNVKEMSPNEMIATFSDTYKSNPLDYFYHPDLADFLSKVYPKNSYPSEGYLSRSGIPMRSKSEVLIANRLEEAGILFRYEPLLKLGNQKLYPDFLIKNPFNGKTVIWEHFGSLNQEGYGQKMNEKMNLYLKHGYIPFETVIYTFEADIKSSQRLRFLIEEVIP